MADSERVPTNTVTQSTASNLRRERADLTEVDQHKQHFITADPSGVKGSDHKGSLPMPPGLCSRTPRLGPSAFRVLGPKQVLVCCWGYFPTRPIPKRALWMHRIGRIPQLKRSLSADLRDLVDVKTRQVGERPGFVTGGLHSRYL